MSYYMEILEQTDRRMRVLVHIGWSYYMVVYFAINGTYRPLEIHKILLTLQK